MALQSLFIRGWKQLSAYSLLNSSVHVIKYLITYSTNGTKKVQTECNQTCLNC